MLIGALGVLLATNQPAALSNFIEQRTGLAVPVSDPNDPVEKEFRKLMEQDDAAQAEVDKWIKENDEFAAKGAGMPPAQLKQRILKRLEPVIQAYEDFIKAHPKHSRARVAYASLLGDVKGEEAAEEQLEKALTIDTNNPAIYNNLANIYGHIGPVTNAFAFYERAIQLSPEEPVYYHNLGTTVYLFRKDSAEYYHLNEQQIFSKAFQLYSNAIRLDPDNFNLASDVAQTYYGIKPLRTEEALTAWTNTFKIAHDEIEREGVHVHFARVKYLAGRYAEARTHLNVVTNEMYADLKSRLLRRIGEGESKLTNAPPATGKDSK
jgi:tetratricopeptide (TPR) repeat protein